MNEYKELNKKLDKIITKSEIAILNNYGEGLKIIKSEITELFKKHSVDGKLVGAEMGKYNRLKKLEKDIQKTVSEIYNENNKEIRATLRDTFVKTNTETMHIINKEGKKKIQAIIKPFDVTKTINESMAGLVWVERMGKHRADLIYDIQKTVKQGIARGDTYITMAEELTKDIDISIGKATTIVRTESSRVITAAQKATLDKFDESGVKTVKKWNSMSDKRVRRSHDKMDGVTIPYKELFILPDGKKTFGPVLSGYPEHDINCRCFLSIALAE